MASFTDYGESIETTMWNLDGLTTHRLSKRGWPKRTTFSREELSKTDPRLIHRDGDSIVVSLTSESARYHIVQVDEIRHLIVCERES